MIALSTGSLHSYGTLRTAQLAADAGFDGLEIMVDNRWDTRDPAYLSTLARQVALPIVSLHAPSRMEFNGWAGDEVERLRRTVELARAVGARTVVVHPPLRYRWVRVGHYPYVTAFAFTPFPRRSRYRRWLLADLGAYQAQSGVTIAIENMPRQSFIGSWTINLFDLNQPADLGRLPAMTLDTTHLATWGVDLLETYNALADRVTHVHLSNYNGLEHRLLDDGRLPLGPFLDTLRRRRYPGAIVVELHPTSLGAENERLVVERLARARAFCREYFG